MSLPADKALLEHWYPEDFQEFRRIVYRAILMILDLTVQFKIRTSCQNKIWLFGWHSDIKELHVYVTFFKKCQYFKLKKLIVQDTCIVKVTSCVGWTVHYGCRITYMNLLHD